MAMILIAKRSLNLRLKQKKCLGSKVNKLFSISFLLLSEEHISFYYYYVE